LTRTPINVQNNNVSAENFTRKASKVISEIQKHNPFANNFWEEVHYASQAVIIRILPIASEKLSSMLQANLMTQKLLKRVKFLPRTNIFIFWK
jgi:hypothetical protein